MTAPLPHHGVHTLVRTRDWDRAVTVVALLHGPATVLDDHAGWAQFDSPTGRILVERVADAADARTCLIVKVDDVETARAALAAQDLSVGGVRRGAHEVFVEASAGGVALVVYEPRA